MGYNDTIHFIGMVFYTILLIFSIALFIFFFQTLIYRDGILLSGPLSSLIQHIVPTTDYYPDQAYLFAFILSSRLFVKPHELLAKVVAVCHAQQRLGDHVSAAQNPHHKV
jgi:hypothetical protein